MDKEYILDIFHKRHSCKLFDKNKKISDEDLKFLLECVRLSPSSFGLEHWKVIIIKDLEFRKKLKKFCWNQNQIDTSSFVAVFLAKKNQLLPNTPYTTKMIERKFKEKEKIEAYFKRYENFLKDKDIVCWSEKQCYIASANMVTMASFIGIDSCFIEGFEKDKVEELLDIDKNNFSVALIVTFGYRAGDITKKYRLDLDEIVEYI